MLACCMAGLGLLTACLLVEVSEPGGIAEGTELIRNSSFERGGSGWLLRDAAPEEALKAPNGGGVMRLAGVLPAPDVWSHVGIVVKSVPADRALQFTCRVRGQRDGQSISVNAFGYAAGQRTTFMSSVPATLKAGEWTELEREYVAPGGTAMLTIFVINQAAEPAFVADAHLVVGPKKKAAGAAAMRDSLSGPGVIRASAAAMVRVEKAGERGVVTFPIPGTYREQVPLDFVVTVEPPAALKGYRWSKRPDGHNWTCAVTVEPPAGPRGAEIRWEALVLVGDRKDGPLPPAAAPAVPDEARPWVRATACVQSDDPAIRARAEELARGVDDVEHFARKVIEFTSKNRGKAGVAFDTLDARKALDCGGSCTSRANLAAALLRARGIPARTVAHLPTWYPKFYEHWLVEYWHPGAGWVWLESTLGRFRPMPYTMAVLNVANPEDEDKAFDTLHLRYVMPGAAHLSVAELSETLYASEASEEGSNYARVEAALAGDEAALADLFAAARVAFEVLSARGRAGSIADRREALRVAFQSGKVPDLARALRGLAEAERGGGAK